MVKVKIHDLKSFEMFLGVAGKFVQQGQIIIRKEYSSLYCKNTKDFSTARLLLDTNTITLLESESLNEIKVSIRDIAAFRSSVSILQVVEQVNEAILNVEEYNEDDTTYAKFIEYKGKAKFKLISVDYQVIEQFISKDLTTQFTEDWTFYINPSLLDIIQNRTGSIVNVQDDVSVYLYPEKTEDEQRVIIDLNARKSTFINSVALPVAYSYTGGIPDGREEVAIHESSFRLLNILRVNGDNAIKCFFNAKYNIVFIESAINNEETGMYIKSRLVISVIKGK